MKDRTLKYTIYFLIIFYFVGICGFVFPQTRAFFNTLTPFALLLSIGFLAYFHQYKTLNIKLLSFFIGVYIVSFLVEMVGVKTGIIFGKYIYGDGLGIKVMETPLMIGINWMMLVYCSKVISDSVPIKSSLRPIFASTLMVLYDIVLEQMAPKLDMWSWENNTVPIRNYLVWFLLSTMFHLVLYKMNIKFTNKLAFPVFIIQAMFFVILLAYNFFVK